MPTANTSDIGFVKDMYKFNHNLYYISILLTNVELENMQKCDEFSILSETYKTYKYFVQTLRH